MKRIAVLIAILSAGLLLGGDIVDRFPTPTRLAIGIQVKPLLESSLIKKNGDKLRTAFADWLAALTNLGADPGQVEQVWIMAGENYPQGTAVIITGKIDPAKVDAKMQQHIKDRKYAVRPFREGNNSCYSLETPVGLNPIPGIPSTTMVAAKSDAIVVAFDKETLTELLKPAATNKILQERFAVHKPTFEGEGVMVGALSPTAALSATDALMAGIKSIELDSPSIDGFMIKLLFRADDGSVFRPRLQAGLNQAKQVFEPMATQQGLDARLIQFFVDMLTSAKLEGDGNDITVTFELSNDAVGRLLRK